jgi:hypothetical protein
MNYTKPVVLIQNNYFEKLGRLIQPCLDFCVNHDHDFIDRSLTDEFDPDNLGADLSQWPGVIIYGSVGFLKRCRYSGLAPWAFYDPEAFASSTWVPVFGEDSLNGDGVVIEVNELLKRLKAGERLHVRPDRDDKAFVGAVHDLASWKAMIETRREERQRIPDPELPCFVSSVKPIRAEYRCWFVDDTLVDISTYRRNGEAHIERCLDPSVMKEVERLAGIYLPMSTVVMDVAETDNGYKVIEFNPINSSGWYGADVDGVFWALSDMIRRGRLPKALGHE